MEKINDVDIFNGVKLIEYNQGLENGLMIRVSKVQKAYKKSINYLREYSQNTCEIVLNMV
jgi:hypothetical protein